MPESVPEGVSKQNRNRKSKIEMKINKVLIDPCSTRVPLRFLGSEEMSAFFTTHCQNKQVDGWKPNNSARPTGQRSHVKISIRTAVHSIQSTASTATQPRRPPVNSQQANHNPSPDVLGALFPCVRD